MSSEIVGGGQIAPAVALPAAAALSAAAVLSVAAVLGSGWLVWKAGKLLVGANDAIDRSIEEKRRQRLEMEHQRKLTAKAGHRQMEAMCAGILEELRAAGGDSAEAEAIRQELRQICDDPLPEDVMGMERRNLADMARLERITARHRRLRETRIADAEAAKSLSVADMMDSLRLAAEAAGITETRAGDVRVANPQVLERASLNQRLSEVSARVMAALEFVVDLAENYGLSQANNVWFQSCFNGVDKRIETMCSPAASNAELKKGIRSLEEIMDQYEMLQPTLEKEKQRLAALYPVYADAARALGEPVHRLKHFKSSDALEAAMRELDMRARRAEECAEIYRRLGPAAYMCYAWDEELRAMGYAVHTRKEIAQSVRHRPERAKLGEVEIPFYEWDQGAMTQLYRVSSECDLQLIVHQDGSVTMQTIADREAGAENVVAAQKGHCSRIKELHQRLKENWFILYDSRETAPAESLFSMDMWLDAEDNIWAKAARQQEIAAAVPGARENAGQETQKTMQKQ